MSGIVAMVNLDGSPIDAALLNRMTEYLTFRGPDGSRVQVDGSAGLGHALLTVTDESTHEEQPVTLDGRRWIVADARVDARQDLIAELNASDQPAVAPDAIDAELILRAYCVWGEDCVSHLLGDFTFAVWDSAARRLFCARDQLGVKPFFYAQLGPTVVVSNTLDCLRVHPGVSRDLNESTIADFLLFGVNQDSSTTTFRDIQRLPPAHSMTMSWDTTRRQRYWTLPVEEPIFFRRANEYPERFVELLGVSIRDRLRTCRVALLMSGGLDSTTLAAVAQRVLRRRSTDGVLQAITSVYDRLIPDAERHYAGLAANHLNIPIHYDVRDDETSIADWDRTTIHTPEPVDNPPAFAAGVEFLRKQAAHARVFLYGEGPDDALKYEWSAYLSYLLRERRVGSLVRALSQDLMMHRRVPLWSSIRQIGGARQHDKRWREEFPGWLDEGFAERCGCRVRWDARRRPSSPHPVRPLAYGGFSDVRWQSLFEDCDINGALSRVEFRHPFLDLRLLQYMLAVPVMPWCRNKLIIRRAMRGALPGEVLRRKKTSVGVNPDFVRVVASGMPRLTPSPDLSRYVNPDKIPTAPTSVPEMRAALRALGLNYWLRELSNN
ncbi:MAG TPA: asparagine synthase-related protein [Vicinamibacterales bacterium]